MTAVLLTRPRAASERLAARLGEIGYACVVSPMLEIAPLAIPAPDISDLCAVMATSAHAFDGTFLPEFLKTLPCYCVGSATAERAVAAGFRDARNAQGDGEALAAQMEQSGEILPGSIVLHLAGRDVIETTAERLAARGVTVRPWVVYEARGAQEISGEALDILRRGEASAALLFSARTAANLSMLLERHGLQSACGNMHAIGISRAAVEPVAALPWRGVAWAELPSEDGVVARLRKEVPCA